MYFDGITFRFNEGTTLGPGARLVLGSNTDTNALEDAIHAGVTVAGWFTGNLNNAGRAHHALRPFRHNIITTVDYDDQDGWPTAADGGGRSLEIISPNGDPDDPPTGRPVPWTGHAPGRGQLHSPAPSFT